MYMQTGRLRSATSEFEELVKKNPNDLNSRRILARFFTCLLYTSDAADERSSVDLGGRRIIKKKNMRETTHDYTTANKKKTQTKRHNGAV